MRAESGSDEERTENGKYISAALVVAQDPPPYPASVARQQFREYCLRAITQGDAWARVKAASLVLLSLFLLLPPPPNQPVPIFSFFAEFLFSVRMQENSEDCRPSVSTGLKRPLRLLPAFLRRCVLDHHNCPLPSYAPHHQAPDVAPHTW